MNNDIGKFLIGIGLALILIGGIFIIFNRFNIGKLPGDIYIERGNFRLFFPITTSIIISIIATIVFRLFKR